MLAVEEREISFLDNVNVVSSTTKDLLLKMLTKDPSKRINWKDLFERELTYAESISDHEIRNKKYWIITKLNLIGIKFEFTTK